MIKLGDYSQLDKFFNNNEFVHEEDWFIQVGKLLIGARQKHRDTVLKGLSRLRVQLAKSMKNVDLQLSDYQQGYLCLVK